MPEKKVENHLDTVQQLNFSFAHVLLMWKNYNHLKLFELEQEIRHI